MTATALERPVAYRANMGTLNAGEISVGSMTLSADDETLTFGSATDPTTGAGIFLGKDVSDYEFRVGDPSARYIHFDGTNWDVNVEDFTAPNPVFTGSVDVEAGEGAVRAQIDSTGGAGRIRLRNASDVVMAAIFVDGSGGTYASDGVATLGGGTGVVVETASGDVEIDGASLVFTNLPTSDPSNAGQLWNDSGTLKVSAG